MLGEILIKFHNEDVQDKFFEEVFEIFKNTFSNSSASGESQQEIQKYFAKFEIFLYNILTKITDATDGIPIFAGAGLLAAFGKNPQESVASLSKGLERLFGFFKGGTSILSESEQAFLQLGSASEIAADGMVTLSTKTVATKSAFASLLASPITWWIVGIGAALGVAAIAWDAFTVTVKEAQQEVDKVSSKIDGLKSEIKQLEEIDYRTDEQNARLESLRQELDVQERILEVEKKRLMQAKYGTSLADGFDSDNYNTILRRATDDNYQNRNSVHNRLGTIRVAQDEIATTEAQIEKLQQKVLEGYLSLY